MGILYVATGMGEAAFRKAICPPLGSWRLHEFGTLAVMTNGVSETRETLRALRRMSQGQAESVRLLGALATP